MTESNQATAQAQVDDRQAQLLEHNNLTTEVKGIKKIETADQYRRVDQVRLTLKEGIAYFEQRWRPHIQAANKAADDLRASLTEDQATAKDGFAYAGRLMADYDDRMEADRQRRQLEEEAQKKKDAQEQKDRLAALAKEVGDKQLEKEIKKAPLEFEPTVTTKDIPQDTETSFATTKHYKVVDLMALVKAVAAGKVPIQALADPTKEFRSGYLHKQTTDLYANIKPDKDGKKWLYPGVLVWHEKGAR